MKTAWPDWKAMPVPKRGDGAVAGAKFVHVEPFHAHVSLNTAPAAFVPPNSITRPRTLSKVAEPQ